MSLYFCKFREFGIVCENISTKILTHNHFKFELATHWRC